MLLQEEIDFNPDQEVKVEIELVFTDDEELGARRKEALDALVQAEGGEIISACRYEEIEYDAVLAKLPPIAAQKIARRADNGLAGSVETFLIRPQSDIRVPLDTEEGEALDMNRSTPDRPAIAAIVDAVPLQNHPAFSEHVEYDDPDNLEELAIGKRVHGTAITSLIVRGDLEANEAPIRRKVHVRPLLFARAGALNEDEIFHPDRLIVDDFVRAVRRMKEGEEAEAPTAPEVIFINVSLGDLKRPFSGRLSPWARALDWLAQKYGVLFFVSAGNAERICISGFRDERDFKALLGEARASATLAGIRDSMRDRRILSPAESVNCITVGALHDDLLNADQTIGNSLDPLPIRNCASPFNRLGLGFRNGVKPDILMPGGRLRALPEIGVSPLSLRCSKPNKFGGLRVAGSKLDAAGSAGFDGWSGASSAATALATRSAIFIYDALLDAYPGSFDALTDEARALVVKALVAHRTSYHSEARTLVENVFGPPDARQHQKRRANVQRLFGLGSPLIDEVISCIENRATLWGVGSVGADDAAEFNLPLPASLSGRRCLRRFSATVAWFSPILTGRRSYKSVRLIVQEPEGETSILTKAVPGQPDTRETARGTLFHRAWEGRQARSSQLNRIW